MLVKRAVLRIAIVIIVIVAGIFYLNHRSSGDNESLSAIACSQASVEMALRYTIDKV